MTHKIHKTSQETLIILPINGVFKKSPNPFSLNGARCEEPGPFKPAMEIKELPSFEAVKKAVLKALALTPDPVLTVEAELELNLIQSYGPNDHTLCTFHHHHKVGFFAVPY